MVDVEFKKKNEVYAVIHTERSILRELYEHFSFQIPNAKFDPRVKNRIWDGMIRMINLKDHTVYVGLIPKICSYLKKSGYTFSVDKNLFRLNDFTDDDFDDIVREYQVSLDIRDYQKNVVSHAIKENRSLIVSVTGSGKSLMIALILFYHKLFERTSLIIVPTQSLVTQMKEDIESYSSYAPKIQTIMEGANKELQSDTECVIATWQSIFRMDNNWFSQFDVVICDECLDGNTLIDTDQGKKKIKEIEKGDLVKTYNEKTQDFEYKKVIKKHVNIPRSNEVFEIMTDDGKSLIISGNHKIFTQRGWVRADQLSFEDSILGTT